MGLTAVCPGTFDPVTNGHLDIIGRTGRAFDAVIVGVLENPSKQPLFEVAERVAMLEEACTDLPNVRVTSFSGLLVEFTQEQGAAVIVKGLRAVSDFEFELQMALMNRKLNPEVETVFMMPTQPYTYVSSRLVRLPLWGGMPEEAVTRVIEATRAALIAPSRMP